MAWRRIGALAGIVALGALAGQVAASGGSTQGALRAVHAGPATVTVPAAWHASRAGSTGRVVLATGDGAGLVTLAFGRPHDRSLAPAGSAVTSGPRVARLGGYRAWTYRERRGTVTVLPTTRGTLAVGCVAAGCARAIGSVAVAGGSILEPAPDTALRLAAPAALATLDAARVRDRAQLAAHPGPEAARRLALAHATALAALRPFGDEPLRNALGAAERAYAALAAAGSAPASVTPQAAAKEVAVADAAVGGAVARLARAGAPATQTPVAVEDNGGVSALGLMLVLLAAALVSALAPAAWRRLRPAPERAVTPPPEAAPNGPAPLAPTPPASGRWDELPPPTRDGLAAGRHAPGEPARPTASSSTA